MPETVPSLAVTSLLAVTAGKITLHRMFVVHVMGMGANDNGAGLPSIEPRTALILVRPVMWNVADATKVTKTLGIRSFGRY